MNTASSKPVALLVVVASLVAAGLWWSATRDGETEPADDAAANPSGPESVVALPEEKPLPAGVERMGDGSLMAMPFSAAKGMTTWPRTPVKPWTGSGRPSSPAPTAIRDFDLPLVPTAPSRSGRPSGPFSSTCCWKSIRQPRQA